MIQFKTQRRYVQTGLLTFIAVLCFSSAAFGDSVYQQNNLTSDVPGLAANTDSNLHNPWGVASTSTGPYWVSDQGSGVSTLYNANGTARSLVVTIPSISGVSPAGPTGTVANSASGFMSPGTGNAAAFIFGTLSGTIDTWNPNNGSLAAIAASSAGASYTGLAQGSTAAGNFLYAANLVGGKIDVYNSSFAQVSLPGSFRDPNLPSGYSPFNVQNVNGDLYVEYAQTNPTTHRQVKGDGLGIVDVFDTNGNFVRRFASNGSLNAPWGITTAPAGFGSFSNDLLIGNFGSGQITAFDPNSGAFLGTLSDSNGNPITNGNLWALAAGNNSPGSNPNAVYFTAGINGGADGLVGNIAEAPEPATWALGLLGMITAVGYAQYSYWKKKAEVE